jgi:hypothetical protein
MDKNIIEKKEERERRIEKKIVEKEKQKEKNGRRIKSYEK